MVLLLGVGTAEPARPRVEVGQIDQVLAAPQGIRFHSTSRVRSVSGRLDFRGRVIVTFVGHRLSSDLPRVLSENDLADIDGSGLLSSVVLESSELGSGTSLVIATLVTRRATTFRVSVDGEDVVVALEEKIGVAGELSPGSHDPVSGRRVLTAADLEPIPGDQGGSTGGLASVTSSRARVRWTTLSPVNLRPTPSLESTPLMVLPAHTPVVGLGQKGNWRQVALGGLEGWVDGAFLIEETTPGPETATSSRVPDELEAFDLGDPGGWEDRVAESLRRRSEQPYWQDDSPIISGSELSSRERALQEASSRRMETTQQDLREARVESAELRIDLARALQRLEEVEGRLQTAETRVVELEGLLVALREDAVASRAELERSSARSRVQERQLEQALAERNQWQGRSQLLEQERNDARSALLLLQVETDGLRKALLSAEEDLAVLPTRYNSLGTSELADATSPRISSLSASQNDLAVVESAASTLSSMTQLAIESTLRAWAKAWSNRDVVAYLSFYSENFAPSQGSTKAWKRRREDRLQQPERIEVEIDRLIVTPVDRQAETSVSRVRVEFQQSYRSDNYQDIVEKAVLLVLEPAGWRIVRERAEPVISMVPRAQ